METRRLGGQGLEVSAAGARLHGDVGVLRRGATTREAIATIHRALELGVTFLDTADMYGPFTNEQLVGRAIADRRDAGRAGDEVRQRARRERRVRSAIRGDPTTCARRATRRCSGSASTTSTSTTSTASTRKCRSRRRSARWPSWSTAGKVRYLGLSEAAPETIRRAHAVHPISRAADRVLAVDARRRGRDPADGARAGHRLRRLQPARARLPDRALSARRGRSPRTTSAAATRASRARTSQRNLATRRRACGSWPTRRASRPPSSRWRGCCHRGEDVVPIPGTKRRALPGGERRRRARSSLSDDDLRQLDEAAPAGAAAGERYPDMSSIDV